MFTSWPSSAFVDGVNTGSERRLASRSPSGIAVPCMVPEVRYSFQAEPVMYPRTMHSMGSISARWHSMVRPSRSTDTVAPRTASRSVVAVEIRCPSTRSANCSNQKDVMAVRTRPLSTIGSSITTSNAEMRSEVTISKRPFPAS